MVLQGCSLDPELEAALGFERVFVAGKDVVLISAGKRGNFSGALVSGTNVEMLAEAARSGARTLIIEDMRIDRSLIDTMAKRGTVLCMPMSAITTKESMDRSRTVFMMKGLFDYARGKGIHVAFVSLAASRLGLCSCMQLMEFAKMIGADEQYAKYSIGTINRAIANGNED
jgi:RNase P/RNase MRP subunit p30